MIQNHIQEPDRAKKGSKLKCSEFDKNQRYCIRLVLPFSAIYLLSQMDVVRKIYHTLTVFPNREKVNRSSEMMHQHDISSVDMAETSGDKWYSNGR
jgi:hypothetical protein